MSPALTRGLCTAVLVLLGMALVDLVRGEHVTLMRNAKSAAEQAEWRRLRDSRDDVAEIYGTPEPHGDVRVIVSRTDRIVTPGEAPNRRLLFPDASGGTALLARSAWLRAAVLALLAGLAVTTLTARTRAKGSRDIPPRGGSAPSSTPS